MPRRDTSELSHGGKYYRLHAERELTRKRAERARLGSAAYALVQRVMDRTSNLTAEERQEVESFAPRSMTRRVAPTERSAAHEMTYYGLTRKREKAFRDFLRKRGWAAPSHRKTGRRVSFDLTKRRTNFLAEALGEAEMLEGRRYREVYGGT